VGIRITSYLQGQHCIHTVILHELKALSPTGQKRTALKCTHFYIKFPQFSGAVPKTSILAIGYSAPRRSNPQPPLQKPLTSSDYCEWCGFR